LGVEILRIFWIEKALRAFVMSRPTFLPMLRSIVLLATLFLTQAAIAAPSFQLQPNEVIALTGGSNMERTRFNVFLQTHLIAAKPELKVKVRNFGWEGDTVFEQWRDGGNVENLEAKRREAERRIQAETGSTSWRQQRDWRVQLRDAGATVVIAQFGQMESLAGVEKLPQFIAAYEKLIAEFADEGRRVVLVSPVPFERSAALGEYSEAIRGLAEKLGLPFVGPVGMVGLVGHSLTEEGHRAFAEHLVKALGLTPVSNEAVRAQVLEFERLWFDYWRPMNWSFLMGDRTNVPYSKDWKDTSKRIFPTEMNDFLPLLKQAEENIWNALAGKPVVPVGVRSSIPVEPATAKPQSPEEELASFQILDDFQVNLFASEADGVVKPIQMRWDERGRLWVACAVSYPQIKPGEKANDYVLVCEDTDGNGKADKFHKFVEGLFMPAGLELGDGGLYVAQGTELLHFKDTDGDEKADTKRIVLGGFGTADSHQMINCINWGFGGELWFTQGHHIYSRVETPYGVETLNRAGVWRLRPRTGHLDPFFQWSSAGANCWGVVTTPYGQPFHKSGANIGSYYSTPGLVRSNLAVNAQALNLCLAPIKQVGMEFLHSSHFPKEMQGRIIIGGYYANLLEQHELKFENGMFSTKLLPNIIETKNNVFRPVEVRCGPDGALYVADWYNPIIGHYQASYRHPDRDKAHGRVWRVSYKGGQVVKKVNLVKASTEDLLEQLDSPERWAAYQSKRLLFEKDSKEVVTAVDAWATKNAANDYRRLQALSLYEAHETARPELLKSLLRAPDARIRAYATRTLSTWARNGVLPEALTLLETQIADDDALVRLEAIVAASYVNDPRAAVVAARSLDKEFNAYHLHALTKTLHATNGLWAALLSAGKLSFDKDEHLIFALQNGWVENNPDDLKNLSGAAVAYQPNAASSEVTAIIRQQIEKHQGNAEKLTTWLKALAGVATAADLPFIFERGGKNAAVLAALKITKPKDADALLEPLFSDTNPALRAQALRLAGAWKVQAFADRIRELAFDDKAPLQAQALDALISMRPDEVVGRMLKQFANLKTPQEVAPLLSQVVSRTEGHAALTRALQKPEALPISSAKLVLQALNSLGKTDAKISPLLMKLAGINAALPAYTKEYVSNVIKAANTFGNAAEGKKIYEQTGCIACHMPGVAQSKIGPDLSTISRGLPIDMIITEVVWPALNIKEGYEAATVTMKDGSVVTGFKQTDTAEAIAIREMATGQVKSIKRSDTQSIQIGGTVMPDGLTATMNEQQLAHLVKYLSQLGAE
jgi:putative heme-binding domain-containing protein